MLALLSGAGSLLGLTPVQQMLGLDIPSEIVGLSTAAAAVILMVAGSLMFPDRSEALSTEEAA
jgi:hypothetical protein